MSKRNLRITMDNISGIPMSVIAEREDIHTSRVGQIVKSTLKKYGCDRYTMTKQQIGAILARRPSYYQTPARTPQGFEYELRDEERHDQFLASHTWHDDDY
jgi:hypothetical protein